MSNREAQITYWLRRLRSMDSGGFRNPQGQPTSLIPQRFAWFELKGDLTPGGTVTGYLRGCPDEGGDYGTIGIAGDDENPDETPQNTPLVCNLQDLVGNCRALGRDSMTAGGGTGNGAYCLAMHDDYNGSDDFVNDVWLIVECQQIAQKIKVSIAAGCILGGATFHPTAVAVMDPGGQDPSHGAPAGMTITNYSTQIGNGSGATAGIICLWDESIPGYLVVDAPCPLNCTS